MYEIFKRLLAMAEERLEVIDCQLSSYSIDILGMDREGEFVRISYKVEGKE